MSGFVVYFLARLLLWEALDVISDAVQLLTRLILERKKKNGVLMYVVAIYN